MNNTRVEIKKGGEWLVLRLKDNTSIKYNKVVNRIGDISKRDISHSNTFVLPAVTQNIQALGLNKFNLTKLATALNSKYEARYFVNEKIFQEGFLVINNTNQDEIKVNFIDEALSIIDKWGEISYRNFLQSDTLTFPTVYKTAIDEMRDYDMERTSVLPSLSEVSGKGFNLALFPNNLNTIGDNFQRLEDGTRGLDTFNPYQSRPVFNAKAILELACETYGFTPIFDNSIDWQKVEKTYIVNEGLDENYEGGFGESTSYSPVISNDDLIVKSTYVDPLYDLQTVINYPSSKAIKPSSINLWESPTDPNFVLENYFEKYCIFLPNVSENYLGDITFRMDTDEGFATTPTVYAVWNNSAISAAPKFIQIDAKNETSITFDFFEFSISKSDLKIPISGTDTFLGVFAYVAETSFVNATKLTEITVSETFLPNNSVSYDDNSQYLTEDVDLTYAAPSKTLKELVSGILQKEGALMDINSKTNVIKFFGYSIYSNKVDNGEFENWSKYLRKYNPYAFNTDFGSSYAVMNSIGLNTPYLGNTAKISLSNNYAKSKYKDSVTNYSKLFKDVESVLYIGNTVTPYFEYKNTGLGMVEYVNNIGSFTQVRAGGLSQGTIPFIASLANVSYALPPDGIRYWYYLVDNSVRCNPQFLLPETVIQNLDLSVPIYVGELGGFFIIEEVLEYIDRSNLVEVKLIKALTSGSYSDDYSNDYNN